MNIEYVDVPEPEAVYMDDFAGVDVMDKPKEEVQRHFTISDFTRFHKNTSPTKTRTVEIASLKQIYKKYK